MLSIFLAAVLASTTASAEQSEKRVLVYDPKSLSPGLALHVEKDILIYPAEGRKSPTVTFQGGQIVAKPESLSLHSPFCTIVLSKRIDRVHVFKAAKRKIEIIGVLRTHSSSLTVFTLPESEKSILAISCRDPEGKTSRSSKLSVLLKAFGEYVKVGPLEPEEATLYEPSVPSPYGERAT